MVTAAIALWNTVDIGCAPEAACLIEDVVPEALLARVVPLGGQNINLTNDFPWGVDASIGSDTLRLLAEAELSGRSSWKLRPETVPGLGYEPSYPARSTAYPHIGMPL